MKKILIAALLPIVMFSCDKQENTNIGFREATCADSTDEGIFEAFTAAEKAQLLKDSATAIIPDEELDSTVAYKYMSGRLLRNNEIFYAPYFVYKLNRPANFNMYVPTNEAQEEYYSWYVPYSSVAFADSVKVNVYNLRHLQLEPGCYRLYYVFTDTSVNKIVLTKGHYDLEIR